MSDAAGIIATVLSYLGEPATRKKERAEEFIIALRSAQARHTNIVTTNSGIEESFAAEWDRASYDRKDTMARNGQPEPTSPYIDCDTLCDRLMLYYPWLRGEIECLRAAAATSGQSHYEINREFCAACSAVVKGLLLGRWKHWLANRSAGL